MSALDGWQSPYRTDQTMETLDFLATVPLFASLERDALQEFASITREKAYPKGSVILFEDDPDRKSVV